VNISNIVSVGVVVLGAVAAIAAALFTRQNAKAAEASARASQDSASAAVQTVELQRREVHQGERNRAVDLLFFSWRRGWSRDNTVEAITLLPHHLRAEFPALVREAWVRDPGAPKRTPEEIIKSHLDHDPNLRADVEATGGEA